MYGVRRGLKFMFCMWYLAPFVEKALLACTELPGILYKTLCNITWPYMNGLICDSVPLHHFLLPFLTPKLHGTVYCSCMTSLGIRWLKSSILVIFRNCFGCSPSFAVPCTFWNQRGKRHIKAYRDPSWDSVKSGSQFGENWHLNKFVSSDTQTGYIYLSIYTCFKKSFSQQIL